MKGHARTPGRRAHGLGTVLLLAAAAGAPTDARPDGPAGDAPADWPLPVVDSAIHAYALLDQLEYRASGAPDELRWDALAWVGGDVNRLWIETEGQMATDGDEGELERFDVEYGRLVAPFWDLQGGIRYQRNWAAGEDVDRFSGVLGLHGLAPYAFEIEADLILSEDGDVAAQFQATYDFRFTQRLILQPRLETAAAFDEARAYGIGEGINSLRLGARLRYEVRREFAPYVGLSWFRRFGDTADFARAEGAAVTDVELVAGVRIWF